MGYRSNVGVAFSKKGFISFFQNNEKKVQAQLAIMLSIADEFRFNLGHKSRLYLWYNFRWCEQEEIKTFEKKLYDIDNESFLFIRLGEDVTDNERIGTWFENPFNLSFHRFLIPEKIL